MFAAGRHRVRRPGSLSAVDTLSSPQLSPIDSLHRIHGATFTDFAGWRLPLRFSGDLAEHRAVRDSAGLFDISHMGQIAVVGPDAASMLAFALVSDVGRLAYGRARYTMLCQSDGGVVDDLIVYRIDEHEFLVIANAANTAAVRRCLVDRSGSGFVSVEDRTRVRALYSLQGPNAPRIIEACIANYSGLPKRFTFRSSVIAGHPVMLARTGYSGEDGFEIGVGVDGAEDVWRRLRQGDGETELLPAGLAARDSLRLEAGLPLYGHELSLERTPIASGYGSIVDFGRSFVGDLALAEAVRNGPEEVLVGLVCSGQRSPRAGHVIRDSKGRPVGIVTSGGPSPTLGVPIAMAYVRRSGADPGSQVLIDVRGRPEPAVVVALPFYRRSRRAPESGAANSITDSEAKP